MDRVLKNYLHHDIPRIIIPPRPREISNSFWEPSTKEIDYDTDRTLFSRGKINPEIDRIKL